MMENNPTIKCGVTISWDTGRKLTAASATLTILRNEFREIFVQYEHTKGAPVRLRLKNVKIHGKFIAEGKASIRFEEEAATVLMSNAPPADLGFFLRLLVIKLKNENGEVENKTTARARLLSSKARSFDEISPATVAEARAAKMGLSKGTETTPSPPSSKRRAPDDAPTGPRPKKLHAPSPLTTSVSELNGEQRRVLDACLGGKNVFFTGSAGTGKSFLLRRIIAALPPDVTMPTASTGVAACHIGGTTLHAFAGIGGGDAGIERCLQMASKPGVAQKYRKCRHLVIDEISMIDGDYFDKIERVARHVRKNDKPFGGIQLILCGDFLQLPPVVKKDDRNSKRFCFQSEAWQKCIDLSFELRIVHRQKDARFVDILNNVRIGRVTEEISKRLSATAEQKIESEGILATQLCSHTNDSNLINESKLKNLTGEEKVFLAHDSEPHRSDQLDSQTIAPSKLVLKKGAQVMLLKNIDIGAGLVNGARGIVVKFEDGIPVVRLKNHKEYVARTEKWVVKTSNGSLISRRQIPLNLAWAFSIHKSQGLTLDCVEMSLSKIFEAGQAYVALSRARSLDCLRVLDFDPKQVWANPTVLEFYQKFRRRLQQTELMPLGRPLAIKNDRSEMLARIKARMKGKVSNKPLVKIS